MDNELEIVTNEGIQDVVTEVAKPNKMQQYGKYAAGAVGFMILGAGICLAVEYGIKFFNSKKAAKTAAAPAEKPAEATDPEKKS